MEVVFLAFRYFLYILTTKKNYNNSNYFKAKITFDFLKNKK